MKQVESSKHKVSKEFIEHLKNTPQIPQKQKQVPLPLPNSQLPSPIVAPTKSRKEEDIKECPIERICLDKPKNNNAPKRENALKERNQNAEDVYDHNIQPELLKPKRK